MNMVLDKLDVFLSMEEIVEGVPIELAELLASRELKAASHRERVIGRVESEHVRRLYGAALRCYGKARGLSALASIDPDPGAVARGVSEAKRLTSFAEVLETVFWLQVQQDLDTWSTLAEGGQFGVRANWEIVVGKDPMSELRRILGV